MKMIDVLVKQANKEIKEGTILKVPDEEFEKLFEGKTVIEFEFNEDHFWDEEGMTVEELYSFDTDFLNSEVELIPPKEKKYLIMLNVRGLRPTYNYLNYYNNGIKPWVLLGDEEECEDFRTHFTKSELQSIQPVREFLEDMIGKYELVEVEENEDD